MKIGTVSRGLAAGLAAFGLTTSSAPGAWAQRGATSVSGTASNNYAASGAHGDLTMDELAALPREVAPFPVPLKMATVRFLAGKKRVYVPSYALMITRAGGATAYSGGGLTSDASRRSSIETHMSGVPDALGTQLATEAYADLIAKLKAAGYEVITQPLPGAPAAKGPTVMSSTHQMVYGPDGAPLTPGLPWVDINIMAFNPVVGRNNPNGDDIIVLLPGMGIDYERLSSSGSHAYGTSADVGARLRFHVMGLSGAYVSVHSPAPYNASWSGSFMVDQGAGTDEPFAILVQTGDKSDNKALAASLAMLGGNMYRQNKIYEAMADPGRFAALTRAAFQGMNASLIAGLQQAAAK
ncbi:MAG TPA: hypothetical protein VFE13_15915 [Caulobacteraceae bacterium]|nr:hypothetical protein [Caulobacteraceae bacterium]